MSLHTVFGVVARVSIVLRGQEFLRMNLHRTVFGVIARVSRGKETQNPHESNAAYAEPKKCVVFVIHSAV